MHFATVVISSLGAAKRGLSIVKILCFRGGGGGGVGNWRRGTDSSLEIEGPSQDIASGKWA